MFKKLFTTVALTVACLQAGAQTLAKEYKSISNGNPISPCVFCADPTAIDYNGRIYVYGSNDHQQYIKNGKKGGNDYGDIKSLVVFSTDDMVNWTFHGTIDVGKLCSSWGWRFAASWAPSAVWRTSSTGKNEFFLYFANSGGSIGVLKASSPLGPWSSPLSKPMIDGDTPGVRPCNWIFDPGVVIDEEGTGYIAFGGGDPQSTGSNLWPGNSRIAKLKKTMTAIDGSAVNMPAPYLFEASELNIIGGRYVYTYSTSWLDRNAWNTYAGRNGQPAPSSCSMCYMVSDTPLVPDSWEYRGEYVPNEGSFSALGADWGNNHTHLHKYQDTYYLFYHGNVLEKTMKSSGAMNSDASGYRSICVNKLTVNESTQKLNKVTMNKTGVAAIKNLDPYQLQEAETMATSGGISYEDFTNITKKTGISSLGNDASSNMQVKMKEGSWTQLRSVDFGTQGASKLMVRAKGEGTVEIRIDKKSAKASATFEIASSAWSDITVDVDTTTFKGQKTLYIVAAAGTVYLDAWQAIEAQPAAIYEAVSGKIVSRRYFDLFGRLLPDNRPHRGIVIEQTTDENGVKHSRMIRNEQFVPHHDGGR